MEPVALHARVVQFRRNGESLRDRRVGAVERGVEAGNLGQVGRALEQHPDRSEVVRLVQRRERNESGEALDRVRIDAHGFDESRPPCTTRWPTPIGVRSSSSPRRVSAR
jgi:hypothetical protein